ncbi:RNA-directed DNA polymerase, eukaryota, reverse transcriptase zinc-binding domain protein [Tanacetum coccineum]
MIGVEVLQELLARLIFRKLIDTLNWEFMAELLKQFDFHDKMIKWIMRCISSTNFSVYVNGESCGYLKGGGGLRQGDRMSPYLFTLVMEFFTLIVERNVNNSPELNYHFGYRDLKITHICFVNDLLVSYHGDACSASLIKKSLKKFVNCFSIGIYSDVLDVLVQLMAWKIICKPEVCGGLGLKDITLWNKDLIVKHLWNIATKKDTLYDVGNGTKTFMWNDNWSDLGLLINCLTNRSLYDARLQKSCSAADLMGNKSWSLPADWYEHFPFIGNIIVPLIIPNKDDKITWLDNNGKWKIVLYEECLS